MASRDNPIINCACGCGKSLLKYRIRIKEKSSKKYGLRKYICYIERKFINGHNNLWKGKHHTEETKRKLSRIQQGLHRSVETEFKKGDTAKEKNINWKGGITHRNSLIRKSIEYIEWRKDVYKRDNWTCQECKKKTKDIIAHHINLFSEFPDLRFDINNGVTLCRSCHFKLHRKLNKEALCLFQEKAIVGEILV